MDQPVCITNSLRKNQNDFMHIPPLSPPSNPSFLSHSIPNSACSSPRISMARLKNKSRNSSIPQDSIALANLERLREIHKMRKSKSCGDERSSAAGATVGLQISKPSKRKQEIGSNKIKTYFQKVAVMKIRSETGNICEKKFKCGALCLFLPGFSKPKQVKNKMVQPEIKVSTKRVSLQKFECGSWTSSAIIYNNDNEEDTDNSNHFFDLPLECW